MLGTDIFANDHTDTQSHVTLYRGIDIGVLDEAFLLNIDDDNNNLKQTFSNVWNELTRKDDFMDLESRKDFCFKLILWTLR